MASPESERFAREDIRLAKFAKALSHPARIVILRRIMSLEECYFNEIAKKVPLAESTVSQHLYELKSAGLIASSYEPPRVKYSLNGKNWKKARKIFKEFLKIKQEKVIPAIVS